MKKSYWTVTRGMTTPSPCCWLGQSRGSTCWRSPPWWAIRRWTKRRATRWRWHASPISPACPSPPAARAPLVQYRVAPDIHGDSGLDGPVLPEPHLQLDSRHAVDPDHRYRDGSPARQRDAGADRRPDQYRHGGAQRAAHCRAGPEVVLMGAATTWAAGARWRSSISKSILRRRTSCLTKMAADHGQAGSHPPGFGHAGSLRAHRHPRYPAGRLRRRTAGILWPYVSTGAGLQCPAGTRSLRSRLRDRSNVMTVRKAPVDIELTGTLTLGMTVADFRAPPPPDAATPGSRSSWIRINSGIWW